MDYFEAVKGELLSKINRCALESKMPDLEWLDEFCRRNFCGWKLPVYEELIRRCCDAKIQVVLGANCFDYLLFGMDEEKKTLSVYLGFFYPANNPADCLPDVGTVIQSLKLRVEESIKALLPDELSISMVSVINQIGEVQVDTNEVLETCDICAFELWKIGHEDFKRSLSMKERMDVSVLGSVDTFVDMVDHCDDGTHVYDRNLTLQKKFSDLYVFRSYRGFLKRLKLPLTYCYNRSGGMDWLLRQDDQELVGYYRGRLGAKFICAVLDIDYAAVEDCLGVEVHCDPDAEKGRLREQVSNRSFNVEKVKRDFLDSLDYVHPVMDREEYEEILLGLDDSGLIGFVEQLREIEESQAIPKMELSDLALSSAFVGDGYSVIQKSLDAFVKYIKTVCYKEVVVETLEIKPVEQTSDDGKDDGLKAVFESAGKNTLVIIKNLENLLCSTFDQDCNKAKNGIKLKAFFNAMDQGVKGTVICTVSVEGWTKLVALFPSFRVIFPNVFEFEKPTPDKLMAYFKQMLDSEGFALTPSAKKYCQGYFEYVYESSALGNLYFTICDSLFDETKRYRLHRIATKGPLRNKKGISLSDVELALADEYKPMKEENLADIMCEIDELVGLGVVKEKVRNFAALATVDSLREQVNIRSNSDLSLHAVFYGNPGTGKTTVAHLIGRIYKSLGILPLGHVVSVKRSDLVSFWVGGTAKLVKQTIKEARGGVLFIDEAYDLVREGDPRDSGVEAINTLVSEMEYLNKDTCVILAGYPREMEVFLKSNPGLASRFVNKLHFQDYDQEALSHIFESMMAKQSYKMGSDAKKMVDALLQKQVLEKDEHFGNARMCRVLLQELKLVHAERLFSEYKGNYGELRADDLQLFSQEDVNTVAARFKTSVDIHEKRPVVMGFQPPGK